MKRLSIATAFVLALTAAHPAFAQNPTETRTIAVGYLDLDLGSAAGRATLKQRVKGAIGQVCGSRPSPKEMVRGKIYRGCVAGAREGSDAQMATLFGGQTLAENTIQVGARK